MFFLISQKYVKKPILVYSELRQYSFWAGMVISFVNLFVFYSFLYFYNLYAQSNFGLDYSSFLSGATLLPFGVLILIVFFVSKKLVNLLGIVWFFTIGSLITFSGVFLLLWINPEIGYVNLWWKLCLAGIGIGFIFPVVGAFSIGKIKPKYTGMASGLISSTYYLGATIGVTLCSLWYMSYARSFFNDKYG